MDDIEAVFVTGTEIERGRGLWPASIQPAFDPHDCDDRLEQQCLVSTVSFNTISGKAIEITPPVHIKVTQDSTVVRRVGQSTVCREATIYSHRPRAEACCRVESLARRSFSAASIASARCLSARAAI
jgi:hypothetical protein